MTREFKFFNRTTEPLTPDEKVEFASKADAALSEHLAATIDKIKEFSVAPAEQVATLADELHAQFNQRRTQFGLPQLPKPNLLYVEPVATADVRKILGSKEDVGGFVHDTGDLIVILQGESKLANARKLAHEQSHYYCDANFKVEFTPNGSDISTYRRGMSLNSPKGKFGYLFEEAGAELDADRILNDQIARLLPSEHQQLMTVRSELIASGKFPPFAHDGLLPVKGDNPNTLNVSRYFFAVMTIENMKKSIPNIIDLLTAARVTGQYLSLAKAIDAAYGEKTFRKFMTAEPTAEDGAKLIQWIKAKSGGIAI